MDYIGVLLIILGFIIFMFYMITIKFSKNITDTTSYDEFKVKEDEIEEDDNDEYDDDEDFFNLLKSATSTVKFLSFGFVIIGIILIFL